MEPPRYTEYPDIDAPGQDVRPPPPPAAAAAAAAAAATAGGRRAAAPAAAPAFTKVCGGVAAVRAACNANAFECYGFVMEPDGKCGYLKSARKHTVKRKGWRTFARRG